MNGALAGFEAEVIDFSSLANVPAITVKPGVADPHWSNVLNDLLEANDLDATQPRNNTTLFDAMVTALMGPWLIASIPLRIRTGWLNAVLRPLC